MDIEIETLITFGAQNISQCHSILMWVSISFYLFFPSFQIDDFRMFFDQIRNKEPLNMIQLLMSFTFSLFDNF